MEIPKILWLKRLMAADRFERCQFFDLPDFLTYRATGARTRSLCSLTCKCTYVPENGWDRAFMSQIGLDAFVQNGFAALGTDVLNAGKPVGDGLTVRAAAELGLESGTPVGSGVIDACVERPLPLHASMAECGVGMLDGWELLLRDRKRGVRSRPPCH
jgi:ribulose kinase